MTSRAVHCINLGHQPYQRVFNAMQHYTAHRTELSNDFLLWLEHDPVFTQGQAGKAEHVLTPGTIPVIQADRGGQVTYHGPGQLVGYLLLDLRRLGLGLKALVRGIESAMIRTLASYGVEAVVREGAPGVYVGQDKIGALGLRVKRGCSYHGLSLNVAMDLEPYQRINPCGLKDTGVTDLYTLVVATGQATKAAGLTAVKDRLQHELCVEYELTPLSDSASFPLADSGS